ncbi:hypothetical protein vseg_005867 [Gypsophila vaccaria]
MSSPLLPPPLSPPPPSPSPFSHRNPTALIPRRPAAPKSTSSDDQPPPTPDPDSTPDPFESRLAQVRLRYRSGTGKKAEIRKEKKGKKGSGPGASTGTRPGTVFLPPVSLKEPMSGGVKVEFGFSPYSERVNGRLAGLGLAALVLVELATGQSVVKYHTPAVVFLQVYFMASVSAVYLKFEKEKVSVWPLQGGAGAGSGGSSNS